MAYTYPDLKKKKEKEFVSLSDLEAKAVKYLVNNSNCGLIKSWGEFSHVAWWKTKSS